jgi:asparaginyl-tRNA synthetase
MSKYISIKDVKDYVGQSVEIRGWLYNKRSSGKLHFLQVRDGTQIIQCVMFKGNFNEETFKTADLLPQESSIKITGNVKEDKRSPIGFEIDVAEFQVICEAQEYPIAKKDHGVEFLMNHRHLWLRSQRPHAMMMIRHHFIRAIHDYLHDHGFIHVDAPILTANACEGTTTLFSTDYFGETAYLSQSGQLYNEPTCQAFGKVYCFGPTFRAEKSKTRRHLMEFWMVEPEAAFMEHAENMDLVEDFLEFIVGRVVERCADNLKTLGRDIEKLRVVKKPFPRITYDEAVEIIRGKGGEFTDGDDFGAEDETLVSESYDRPVIIEKYPTAVKAFYMKRDPEDPSRVLGMDVIAPDGYGEIVGGGQREDDIDVLLKSIDDHGLPREAFSWYLDVRRYGSVPHAGFGLGVERTLMWICGVHHLRETIPFPRLIGRLAP